jgi:hypothetical protein
MTMRGGLRPRFRARRKGQAMRHPVKPPVTLRLIIQTIVNEEARSERWAEAGRFSTFSAT